MAGVGDGPGRMKEPLLPTQPLPQVEEFPHRRVASNQRPSQLAQHPTSYLAKAVKFWDVEAKALFNYPEPSSKVTPESRTPFQHYIAILSAGAQGTPDSWQMLALVFGFQRDSMTCQTDNAASMIASRLSNTDYFDYKLGQQGGREGRPGSQIAGDVLKDFRNELLHNYKRWCSFLAEREVSLQKVYGADDVSAAATEVALYMLIWGEAGNLRFCPEFLCFLYHKMAAKLLKHIEGGDPTKVEMSYLDDVIIPAYGLLSDQVSKAGHDAVNHTAVKNYDDFNETFWRDACLELDLDTMLKKGGFLPFRKTFVERQSWLLCIMSFWRVHTFHFVALHLCIAAAACQYEGVCSVSQFCAPAITLYVCGVLKDMWDLSQAMTMRLAHDGSFLAVVLVLLRGAVKVVLLFVLIILYSGDSDNTGRYSFQGLAFLGYALAIGSELVQGLNGFVTFLPSKQRITGRTGRNRCSWATPWSILTSMFGLNTLHLYTIVHIQPRLHKKIGYVVFWICVLATKFSFSYFVLLSKLVSATYEIYDIKTVSNIYDFGVFQFSDPHNIIIIVAVWLGGGTIYFIDMQVWFVLWANIFAVFEGLQRRVGEVTSPNHVVAEFHSAHKLFFKYAQEEVGSKEGSHIRFSYVWNEVVGTMREEDIIDDADYSKLKYFLVQLRMANITLPMLPEFLFAGALQRGVQDASKFEKDNTELLKEYKRLMSLAKAGNVQSQRTAAASGVKIDERLAQAERIKGMIATEQAKLLRKHEDDGMVNEALSQFFITLFLLVDGLCRDRQLSEELWNIWQEMFADTHTKPPPVERFATPRHGHDPALLFWANKWPGVVTAVLNLVKDLTGNKVGTVSDKVDKVVDALIALLDTQTVAAITDAEKKLLARLASVKGALVEYKGSREEIPKVDIIEFIADNKTFLQRSQVFISAGADSQPGHVKSEEATRRITFFINSLFIKQPEAKDIGRLPAFGTLTPYYNEDVILPIASLREETADGVTVLEYLRTIYQGEWESFVQRVTRTYGANVDVLDVLKKSIYESEEVVAGADKKKFLENASKLIRAASNLRFTSMRGGGITEMDTSGFDTDRTEDLLMELQMWASHRAQTLARTVRGMMYFSQAIRLMAALEQRGEFQPESENPQLYRWRQGSYLGVLDPHIDTTCPDYERTLDLAESKYRYVVSCQIFSKMQTSKDASEKLKGDYIERLARTHPGLRIAFVEERAEKFFSVLQKWDKGRGRMVTEYEVQLPGPILVGEGKPNNQNHAIIFTRGEACQAIDMNQDNALEDALKCRQLMQEFQFGNGKFRNLGRIVGYREHVFTHNVSSVANFFSLQELGFVTATQRVLDQPLGTRFHYGHPDVFDRISAMTMGGISKSSKGLHLSEDIFAGFNYVLRGGESTQCDYLQCGKGRDTGVSQISGFTAKISMGNGMQCRSRDVQRLAQQFDFFRLLTFYYSSVGGFMTQVLLVLSIYLYIYSKLYIAFIDPEELISQLKKGLDVVSSQYIFQLGFLLILPIPMVVAVEFGLARAFSTLMSVLLRLSIFFFIFSTGTIAYYVNSAIQTGQAKYQATGRGFVIAHEPFLDQYKGYLLSHFVRAFELLLVLIIYAHFEVITGYWLQTFSVWMLVVGWLYTPIMFNPNGLDLNNVQRDFSTWWAWMTSPVNDAKKSWLAWFTNEARGEYELQFRKKLQQMVRRLRFLLITYGFLRGIKANREDNDQEFVGVVYMALVLLALMAVVVAFTSLWHLCITKLRGPNKQSRSRKVQRMSSMLLVVAIFVVLAIILGQGLATFTQVLYVIGGCVFLLWYVAYLMLQFVKDAVVKMPVVRAVFRTVHMAIGVTIMGPVMLLSFLPVLTDFQTRMLFNQDFSTRFNIAKIFVKEDERHQIKKAT